MYTEHGPRGTTREDPLSTHTHDRRQERTKRNEEAAVGATCHFLAAAGGGAGGAPALGPRAQTVARPGPESEGRRSKDGKRRGPRARGARARNEQMGRGSAGRVWARCWPLHDIVITNIVWCTAYTKGVGEGVESCSIAVQ